jgi:hypothetical protein
LSPVSPRIFIDPGNITPGYPGSDIARGILLLTGDNYPDTGGYRGEEFDKICSAIKNILESGTNEYIELIKGVDSLAVCQGSCHLKVFI